MGETPFDENAFYGHEDKSYVLEGNGLRPLYQYICRKLALHADSVAKNRFSCPNRSHPDAVIIVNYHSANSREAISIHFFPCVADSLFPPEVKKVEKLLESIAGEKGFRLVGGSIK